jgi:hypothetical protein
VPAPPNTEPELDEPELERWLSGWGREETGCLSFGLLLFGARFLVVGGAALGTVFAGGVEDVGVVAVGAHDSDTFATPSLTGNAISDNGVPGGTSTLNDKVCPVIRVTVNVH